MSRTLTKWNTYDPSALEEEREEIRREEKQSQFLTLDQGCTTLRFLPPMGDERKPWQMAWEHWVTPPGQTKGIKFNCTQTASCPACKLYHELSNSSKSADQDAAWAWKKKRRMYSRVVVRGREDEGVMVFPFGPQIHSDLVDFLQDGGAPFFDSEDGYDIVVKRTGEKKNTKYKVRAAREVSPLTDDPVKAEEFRNQALAINLAKFRVPTTVEDAQLFMGYRDDDEDEDDVYEAKVERVSLPKPKATRRKKAAASARRRVADDLDEKDDGDDEW